MATIGKWGNSPALRIPATIMEQAEFKLQQRVKFKVSRGKILIEPDVGSEYDLDSLVAAITPKNTHAEQDLGPRIGKELL
jgi:antitoxin MazE